MNFDQISEAAKKGALPKKLSMAEKLCWYEMRDLHWDYRRGTLDREEAKKLKIQYIAELSQNTTKLENGANAHQRLAKMWKDIEAATSAYRKEKTRENADRIIEILYGIPA